MHTYPYYDRFDIKQVGNRLLGFLLRYREIFPDRSFGVRQLFWRKITILTDTARDYARPMSFYLRVKTSRRKLFESTKMKNFKSRPFVCLKTRRWKIVETSNTDETVFPLRTWFTPKNSRSWKFCDTRPWKPRVSYVAIVFIFVNTSVKIVTLKYEKLNN